MVQRAQHGIAHECLDLWPALLARDIPDQRGRASRCATRDARSRILTGPAKLSGWQQCSRATRAASTRSDLHGMPLVFTAYRLSRAVTPAALRLVLNYLSFIVSATCFGPWLLRGQSFDVSSCTASPHPAGPFGARDLRWFTSGALVPWVQDLWPQSLEATSYVRNQRLLNAHGRGRGALDLSRSDLLLVQSRSFIESVAAMAGARRSNITRIPATPPSTHARRVTRHCAARGFNVVFRRESRDRAGAGYRLDRRGRAAGRPSDVRHRAGRQRQSRRMGAARRCSRRGLTQRFAAGTVCTGSDAGIRAGLRAAGQPCARSRHEPDDSEQGSDLSSGGPADRCRRSKARERGSSLEAGAGSDLPPQKTPRRLQQRRIATESVTGQRARSARRMWTQLLSATFRPGCSGRAPARSFSRSRAPTSANDRSEGSMTRAPHRRAGKKVLVLGAAGMLGNAVLRFFARTGTAFASWARLARTRARICYRESVHETSSLASTSRMWIA